MWKIKFFHTGSSSIVESITFAVSHQDPKVALFLARVSKKNLPIIATQIKQSLFNAPYLLQFVTMFDTSLILVIYGHIMISFITYFIVRILIILTLFLYEFQYVR